MLENEVATTPDPCGLSEKLDYMVQWRLEKTLACFVTGILIRIMKDW